MKAKKRQTGFYECLALASAAEKARTKWHDKRMAACAMGALRRGLRGPEGEPRA